MSLCPGRSFSTTHGDMLRLASSRQKYDEDAGIPARILEEADSGSGRSMLRTLAEV